MKNILVTGATGFIGFHLSRALLETGHIVVGIDNMSDYYDIRMKEKRLEILGANKNFSFTRLDIAEYAPLEKFIEETKPDEIVHLAAQAGVRYSLTNPWVYADTNYRGTMNIFEAAKRLKLPRVIYASSSSVYGANTKQPFSEDDRTDSQISIYGASKRADELLAHSYNHLYGTEMIGLRFFTVYGPWGRPDLALFIFTKNILRGLPIKVFNEGRMSRNYTFITDITDAIVTLIGQTPSSRNLIYNIGGDQVVPLMRFIELIEKELGKTAEKNMLPLQPGDVPDTTADCSAAARDFGYKAKVSIEEGISIFTKWFRENEEFALSLKEPKQ